eukprot:403351276
MSHKQPLLETKGNGTVKSTVDNTLSWKLWHSINYMLGGLLFVSGSFMYYPSIYPQVDGFVLGGWLFTIGSANFLFADVTEWLHFKNQSLRAADEENQNKGFSYKDYELSANFFFSCIGSFLYLVGSIMFIPATNLLVEGEIVFIVGSLIIFLSQLQKVIRAITSNPNDLSDSTWRYSNVKDDLSGLYVDIFAGLGGLFYLIGTYLFSQMTNYEDQLRNATHFFVVGGTFFTLSGLAMQKRYYL